MLEEMSIEFGLIEVLVEVRETISGQLSLLGEICTITLLNEKKLFSNWVGEDYFEF